MNEVKTYMDGFTIKCNICGNETVVSNRKRETWKGILYKNKQIKVDINWGYEEGEIVCKCGNKIAL